MRLSSAVTGVLWCQRLVEPNPLPFVTIERLLPQHLERHADYEINPPSTVAGQDGVSGNASGSIAGNAVDFIVTWNPADGGGTTHFRGTVGADGIASGTATGASAQDLNKHLEFEPGPWESVAALTCPAAQAPAAQAPAAQPKQGPTVTPTPGLTGVTFHVTDRSGVASQCTYSSEGFQSSFGLPANGSFDLDVPAVQLFRNRTGTVTCDNGTSTNTSVFY